MSPLEIAVRNKDPKTVKFLLELGADPNTLAGIEKKMGFEIPMIFIALTGFNLSESVRTLQSSGVACDSENPKNHVFSQEELDIIKALVDHGADLNTHSFTKLLIFTALEFKDKNPVKILLRSPGFDRSLKYKDQSILEAAILTDDIELIELCDDGTYREFLEKIDD